MNFIMPSDEQIETLADNLDGLEETWSKALETNLKEIGLDTDLRYSVVFLDKLEDHVFCCEECDTWKRSEVRVYNEVAEMKMCEECDDNY